MALFLFPYPNPFCMDILSVVSILCPTLFKTAFSDEARGRGHIENCLYW